MSDLSSPQLDKGKAASNVRPMVGTHFGQVAQITEHVFLCSVLPLRDARIESMNFKLIVSATIEPPTRVPGADLLQVPVDDTTQADIGQYFDLVADRIHLEARQGHRVLVHCMAGVSRSAALVLAYLVKHAGLSLRQGHALCKSRRPFVRPNAGFWHRLCAYELAQRGEQSVRMVDAGGGGGLVPDIYQDEVATAGGGGGGLCFVALHGCDSRPTSDKK